MTKPTQAQIEAAAKAMCLARKPNHPSFENDEQWWQFFGSKELYLKMASLAITAAAEVGEWKETAQSNAMQVLADRNAELARNRESLWNKLNAADKKLKEIRAATIERCAQVVWDVEIEGGLAVGDRGEIAAAIRALKDKP